MMRIDQTVHRETLQQDIYSWQDDPSSNTLEVHIHNLRRKLGKTASAPSAAWATGWSAVMNSMRRRLMLMLALLLSLLPAGKRCLALA